MNDDETRFCGECGIRLRPENDTGCCAECRWTARNARLRAAEREAQRARRRETVQKRIAKIEGEQ